MTVPTLVSRKLIAVGGGYERVKPEIELGLPYEQRCFIMRQTFWLVTPCVRAVWCFMIFSSQTIFQFHLYLQFFLCFQKNSASIFNSTYVAWLMFTCPAFPLSSTLARFTDWWNYLSILFKFERDHRVGYLDLFLKSISAINWSIWFQISGCEV